MTNLFSLHRFIMKTDGKTATTLNLCKCSYTIFNIFSIIVNINSDCVLIGTQNADYTGTCEQNDATMSRFACIQFDYPKSIRPMIESVVGKDRLSAEYFKQVDGFYSLLHDSVQKGTLDNSCLNIRGFCRALHAVAMVPGASSLKKQVQLHVINTCPVDERNLLEQHLNMRITL